MGKQSMAKLACIQEAIEKQEWEKARNYLGLYLKNEKYNDVSAILEASIFEGEGKRDKQWQAIKRGLEFNPGNYELYVMLGNYYLETNLYQSYLCYENALFYCNNQKDKEQIQSLLVALKEKYEISVPKAAIIILSYNLLAYTKECIQSIRENTPEESREIIVVDNASEDGSVLWLKEQRDIKLIENKENVGFPAGCNQGIASAEEDSDIFLLNNDTILPMNALFWLRMGLYESEYVGSCGSVSNYVSNYQAIEGNWKGKEEILEFAETNNVPMEYPYEEKLFLIGFALLVKRKILNKIGVLDEIFSPGNSEDVDYGLRVMKAGYKNILCKNSFILHFGSKSFGKLGNDFSKILHRNQMKLNRKWGMDLQYYVFPRMELVNLIQENREKNMNVLDIGCGCGAIMAKIKSEYPRARTYGVEMVSRAANLASVMGDVICADVEQLEFPYQEEYFDYCIMGNVLEYLREPKGVLERLRKHMKRGGKIIVSMPNMKHWSVILPLLTKDVFPYADVGILDRTHLKMYTCYEIQKLIISAGYCLESLLYTTVGRPNEKENKMIQELAGYMEEPDISTFMAYQYLVVATVK